MGTSLRVSPDEYLHASFDGREPEYVCGEIVERGMPNYSHSRTERKLLVALSALGQRVALFPAPNLRLRLGPEEYRIPDISVFAGQEPTDEVPAAPPFATIEIVSPDDSYTALVDKLRRYRNWGVKHVWLADPANRELAVLDENGLHEVTEFRLIEYDFTLTPADLF